MTRWTTHGPDGHSDHQDNDDNFHAEEASPWGDDDEGKITQAQSRSPSSPTLSLLKQWVARLSWSPDRKRVFYTGLKNA